MLETIKTANGPPKMMVTVAVKNIINAFGPSPITAFKSILKVSKTREAGRRYLDATKYRFVSLGTRPVFVKTEGKK